MSGDTQSLNLTDIDRRKMLLGLLFGSAASVAWWRLPRRHLDFLGREKLDDIVPKTIGSWKFVAASGLVVPPEDQLARTLYTQLLTRVYWDNISDPVMLLIAQSAGQSGILQVHRPETCYPASGYHISPVTEHEVPLLTGTLPTNRLTATADGRSEQIIYWIRVGDHMPTSWSQQKLDVAKDNIRGVIPDAVLVRISTVSSNPAVAQGTLDSFARSLVESLAPTRRSVLIA